MDENNLENNAPDISGYSFPHLNDTSFPLLENVDVYKYENNFDYERWNSNVKVHLCSVLWNSDYKNVVKFKDNKERDNYFDNISQHIIELRTQFNVAPNGAIKIPVPYQVATRYNYLYVDLPIMTSEEQPINYESKDRTSRFYYFIEEISQNSPSSTLLILKPDNWTTFINNVDITYMMLERGHAPMSVTSVEDYLNNPISNNRYLLAPDYDFSTGNDIVRNADFIPVNNENKYIMFATTMSTQQIINQKLPVATENSTTPATFEDSTARNGYQYIVNDYVWNVGNYDYSGLVTETTNYQSATGTIPNNMTMIACHATNANTLFATMSEKIPFLYSTIKACFMVDETMFVKGQEFMFCGVTCYEVEPAVDSIIETLRLKKSDFNYDRKYSDIAKLYTSPYAHIEVTDNNGVTKEFKIENTGTIAVHQAVSLAFPYIRIQAYISGINGNSSVSYKWMKLNNTEVDKIIYSDDFGDYTWNWDIPTYALYVRSYDEYRATNYPKQAMERYNAIAEYHKAVGMDNTQYENSKDAANTTQTMTNNTAAAENTNAVAMANTINTNNVASANTAQTNANASAITAEANTNNIAANNIDNTDIDCARNTDVMNNNLHQITQMTIHTQTYTNQTAGNTNYITALRTGIQDQQSYVTAVASGAAQIGQGISSAVSSAGIGNLAGGIGAAIGMGFNLASTGLNTWATITANDATADASITATDQSRATTNTYNGAQANETVENLQNNTEVNNEAATAITANTSATMNTNAANTKATEIGNAGRTNTTSVANADRTKDTSISNANRTQGNTNTNAELNRNLAVANSNYTRNNSVDNAKIALEQKRLSNWQQYNTQRLAAPVGYGSTTGDPTLDAFMRRGLQIKIKTQPDSSIAQAGDLMLRYGYALNQIWNIDMQQLNVMKHFTYWKAFDIWINAGEGVNQGSQGDIERAFLDGVTVWTNPDEIGKVSIYDN